MGTRGTYGFKVDGRYFVTYNHFDSYPAGLGAEIVSFINRIRDENGWNTLKKRVLALKLVGSTDMADDDEVERYKEYADTGVSSRDIHEWYVLLRNLQMGAYLHAIYDGDVEHLIDDEVDIKDNDYTYIIDLDTMKFIVYSWKNEMINVDIDDVVDDSIFYDTDEDSEDDDT